MQRAKAKEKAQAAAVGSLAKELAQLQHGAAVGPGLYTDGMLPQKTRQSAQDQAQPKLQLQRPSNSKEKLQTQGQVAVMGQDRNQRPMPMIQYWSRLDRNRAGGIEPSKFQEVDTRRRWQGARAYMS